MAPANRGVGRAGGRRLFAAAGSSAVVRAGATRAGGGGCEILGGCARGSHGSEGRAGGCARGSHASWRRLFAAAGSSAVVRAGATGVRGERGQSTCES
jgi:hypothetical protein|uniref:Uncharacterized protein n=1 Tax=Zea mays TaxID=4577 RepID=C0P739_MAIZE|nr:unknown [Zea mays]